MALSKSLWDTELRRRRSRRRRRRPGKELKQGCYDIRVLATALMQLRHSSMMTTKTTSCWTSKPALRSADLLLQMNQAASNVYKLFGALNAQSVQPINARN